MVLKAEPGAPPSHQHEKVAEPMLEDPNVSDFLHQLALGDRDRQQVEIDAVVIDAMDCIASLWDKMTEKGLNRRTDELLQT